MSAQTARVIELMLASNDVEQVKTGLQRACEILESGQAFLSYDFLKIGLVANLQSNEMKVRRWAYKLVALLRDGSYLNHLEAALLTSEMDPENRGWASAAFSGLADEGRKDRLIAKLSDYRGSSLELAAKLYARGEPAREELNVRVWEDDAVARKWLCLLCAYARANTRTIDSRFDDLDLVRNSINDDDIEVVEYTIWAERKHPDGSFRGLRRRPDELLAFPNVRRWLYQLLTKDKDAAESNIDLLLEAMNAARETSEVAREGLALGLKTLRLDGLRTDAIDWFQAETSLRVRLALVDHLAMLANDHQDGIARSVLVDAFLNCDSKLLAAKIHSVEKPDWGLSKIDNFQPSFLTMPVNNASRASSPTAVIINGDIIMGSKIVQSGAGNSMTGVGNRDVIESTINSLNKPVDQNFKDLTPLIETFLRALVESKVDAGDKDAAIGAADEVAKSSGDEKRSKLQTLKSIVRGLLSVPGMAAKAVEDGQKLVDAIQQAVS